MATPAAHDRAATTYANFDLLIEPATNGYTARVLDSPAGQALAEFSLPAALVENGPASAPALLPGGASAPTPAAFAWDAATEAEGRVLGAALFGAVFGGPLGDCLGRSLELSAPPGLRLRLRLNSVPDLATLPWELLYDPARLGYLALSGRTPLVRYMELPGRAPALAVRSPLRVVAVLASPAGYQPLDIEGEWQRLQAALAEPEAQGRLTLERLATPSLAALQERLRRGPCHILHFSGHGGFDPSSGGGLLLLGDSAGGQPVSAAALGTLLRDHDPLRLVLLNACEGARGTREDPFAGTAQGLVRQGIPAVIAMQAEVAQEVAAIFAAEFYAALADGLGVDTALAEARKAVFTAGEALAWALPVLYMRSPDGVLWQVAESPNATQATGQPVPATDAGAGPPHADWWSDLGLAARGDVIVSQVGGSAGDVVVGKNISINKPAHADDASAIAARLAAVTAALHAGKREATLTAMADFQLKLLGGELAKTGSAETPSANTITQVGDWLAANVPEVRTSLAELFRAPATARVLAAAGASAVAWSQQTFGG